MEVEIFPIGHVSHALKPVVLEYLPAVQAIQVAREVAPTVADAVAAAQFAQVVAEAPEYFPATQIRLLMMQRRTCPLCRQHGRPSGYQSCMECRHFKHHWRINLWRKECTWQLQ